MAVISDVAVAAPPRFSRPSRAATSTAATRLWTVWNDWRERRSLASRRRRPSEAISLIARSGWSREQAPHVRTEDRDRLAVLDRLDGRRARLAAEHRELAEDLARPELRERDRATVGVLESPRARDPSGSRSRCRWRPLTEHHLARRRTSAAPPAPRPERRSSSASVENSATWPSSRAVSSRVAAIGQGISTRQSAGAG